MLFNNATQAPVSLDVTTDPDNPLLWSGSATILVTRSDGEGFGLGQIAPSCGGAHGGCAAGRLVSVPPGSGAGGGKLSIGRADLVGFPWTVDVDASWTETVTGDINDARRFQARWKVAVEARPADAKRCVALTCRISLVGIGPEPSR